MMLLCQQYFIKYQWFVHCAFNKYFYTITSVCKIHNRSMQKIGHPKLHIAADLQSRGYKTAIFERFHSDSGRSVFTIANHLCGIMVEPATEAVHPSIPSRRLLPPGAQFCCAGGRSEPRPAQLHHSLQKQHCWGISSYWGCQPYPILRTANRKREGTESLIRIICGS